MALKTWIASIAVGVGLAGCIDTNVSYSDRLTENQTYNWNIVDVNVTAPRTLTTSTANTQAPNVDIIWRGDGPGDVYAQVEQIMGEAAMLAGNRLQPTLKGGRGVRLDIVVHQFHSLTERARSNIGGIHNIDFTVQAFDAVTGAALSAPTRIEADREAYGGARAAEAVARGQTMRVEIIDHVANVLLTWMGQAGPNAVPASTEIMLGR